VIQGGLQALLYYLEDMHKLIPQMEEDMDFQRG
jgi:hypothetical protein